MSGAFRFVNVAAGQYDLARTFEGFKPGATRVRVGARSPAPQRLVLGSPSFSRKSRSATRRQRSGATAGQQRRRDHHRHEHARKPAGLRQRLVATMSQFLDAGSIGNGGVTIASTAWK